MRSFLASLLAASAFAQTIILIDYDSEMLSLVDFDGESTDYTWVAEGLDLNTSDDGTDMTFCFEPTDAAWTEADDT